MAHVFFVRSEGLLQPEVYTRLMSRVPAAMQEEIARYRDPRDRQRSLLGKVLLQKGLETLKLDGYSLARIRYNGFGRPGFDEALDFNISHSGVYTVCAIGMDGALGIDVEKIRDVAFGEFEEQFSETEWAEINTSRVPQRLMFDTWTKKEAFLKSTGTGLSVFPGDVTVNGPVIVYGNVSRYAQEVLLDPGYVCHVVTAHTDMGLVIHPMSADDL